MIISNYLGPSNKKGPNLSSSHCALGRLMNTLRVRTWTNPGSDESHPSKKPSDWRINNKKF